LGGMVVSITYMLGVATMCMNSVANFREVEMFFMKCLSEGLLLGSMVVSINYMLGVATMCMGAVANFRVMEVFFMGCLDGGMLLGSMVVSINYMLRGATRDIYLGIVSAAAGLFSLVSLVSTLQGGPCSCS
jgi:hypothetical protein